MEVRKDRQRNGWMDTRDNWLGERLDVSMGDGVDQWADGWIDGWRIEGGQMEGQNRG